MRSKLCIIVVLASQAVPLPALGGDVGGTVQAGGAPVAGARVTLFFTSLSEFFETRTGGDGSFSFTGIPVPSFARNSVTLFPCRGGNSRLKYSV